MMKYTAIDLESYPRKKHFAYFKGLAYPYVGVTVNVEITDWLRVVRAQGYPFFLSFLYAATRAANSVPQFRQRISEDRIIEYEACSSSYTVALPDETYCYCEVACELPIGEFIAYAKDRQEQAAAAASVDDGADAQSLFFVSSLPWLTYTNLLQPVPVPADSNPRISWGKYFEDSHRVLMPVTVLCHHALVDGIHIHRFYENLQAQLADACKEMEQGEPHGR
ncbi:MAG: CatA-like O-acetyltransferase [Eubacteriales bacterium]|nr:CatA-like O-acetyltransferase [Eubacteriales bacterium]